jgi:hypothetical protein
MANIWGPMGWLTLHSVAAAYPDNPSPVLRTVTLKFLDNFAKTITCQYCRDHFTRMLTVYQNRHPEFLDSRRDFFLFTVRAHNTVNRRLDKPVLQTVADCMQTLRNATANVSPSQFRLNYFSYVARNWIHEMGGDGRINFNIVNEMKTTNNNMFSQKNDEFTIEMEEGDVLEHVEEYGTTYSSSLSRLVMAPTQVGFKAGRLTFGRK